MPTISEFFGIKILMYYEDHFPPHFHARLGELEILVDIENGAVLRGVFPAGKLKLVLAWCEIHRAELLENWRLAHNHKSLLKINPLEP